MCGGTAGDTFSSVDLSGDGTVVVDGESASKNRATATDRYSWVIDLSEGPGDVIWEATPDGLDKVTNVFAVGDSIFAVVRAWNVERIQVQTGPMKALDWSGPYSFISDNPFATVGAFAEGATTCYDPLVGPKVFHDRRLTHR